MKIKGKCLIGSEVNLDSYTSNWMSIKLHPQVYFRRIEEIQQSLETTNGLYTLIDMVQYIVIRFSDKADVTTFYRKHHEYI